MTETWTRSYTPGTGRRLVIGWEAAALALLGWASVRLYDLTGPAVRVLVVVLAATWAAGAWRIARMGVYTGPGGVRIRGLLHTRTVAWHDVASVRLHRAVHRIGPWEVESGMTVLLERRDGVTVGTELWAQGIDFHSRPTVFRAVYHELRERHLAAVAAR